MAPCRKRVASGPEREIKRREERSVYAVEGGGGGFLVVE